ncbi:MAG: two-component regulator propeller domain-containing protein [Bacteroidota bacterium]|nr:two-component regulator propeller domain-containing protein [Bacteroidota bacterium]
MSHANRTILLTLFLLLVVQFSVFAYTFNKYNVDNGLSENTVQSILQDQKGYMWFGTKDGLNRFDGVEFKTFRNEPSNPSTIGNNFIRCLYQSEANNLWIGTDLGIFLFNTDTNISIPFMAKDQYGKPITGSVCSICEEDRNTIWIGGFDGIYIYNKSRNVLKKLRSEFTWNLLRDRAGTIWFATRQGLLCFNRETGRFYSYKQPNVSNQEVLCLHEDSDGDIWVGTWEEGLGLLNKADGKITYFFNKSSLNFISHIRAIQDYKKSMILFGADDGLYLLNKKTNQTVRIDNMEDPKSLSDQNVYTIYKDKEEGFWIGTYFGGVNYLSYMTNAIENYYHIPNKNSLSGRAVSQFCEDAAGNMWIATEDGGLNYFNTSTKTFQVYLPKAGTNSLSYHNLHALLIDSNHLWIGTFSRGIDILDLSTKRFKNFSHRAGDPASITDNCVFSLFRSSDNVIYVGTAVGACCYDRKANCFRQIPRLDNIFVYDMREDAIGNIWFATYGWGLLRYNKYKRTWKEYSPRTKNLVFGKFTAIYIDSKKRLWFASEGRGVFKYNYNKDNFTVIDKAKGLPNNVIYGILDDKYGNLWISSNGGITQMNPKTLKMQTYTKENGLLSKQLNYKSSFKSSRGDLYFGGLNGFNIIRPADFINNDVVPEVVISGFEFLTKNKAKPLDSTFLYNLNVEKKIVLHQNQASFKIDFASLSYRTPYKNQYAYMLENQNDHWVYLGNQKSISFIDLAPGKYRFRVIGSNNNGVWNETGDYLDIVVEPSFWRSGPMEALYVIVFLVLLFYFVRSRMLRRIEKEKYRFEELKIEKEKEVYASKINFFTNIAHEIRTPVTLISAPLECVLKEEQHSNESKDNLLFIKRNADRLLNLVNQLLDFRKIEEDGNGSLQLVKTDMKEFLSNIVSNFEKTSGTSNLEISISCPEKEVVTCIDEEAVTKIVSNLLSNALKFAVHSIQVQLSEELTDGKECITICVQDDGPGIPKGYEEKIFEPFYQIDNSHKEVRRPGTGIGLAFARQLAVKHKGNLRYDVSEKGARFKLSLPGDLYPTIMNKKEGDPPISHRVEETTGETISGKHSNATVLIVEDSPDMMDFMAQNLKKDYMILTANNGLDAFTILEEKSADLIVSDVMMPKMDGFELVKRLKQDEQYCHIPVLLLSALTDTNSKIEGLEFGADAYMEKPFSIVHLKAQINSMIRNRELLIEKFSKTPMVSYQLLANNNKDKEFLDKLNAEIERNILDNTFSIETLAVSMAMSRSKLQRKIKDLSGLVPNDYIRLIRLKKSAALLASGEYKINEVCYMVGFNSPSYFAKCFLKQFGCLPKDFPNKMNEKEA